jgi:hypothetical protein
MDLLTLIVVLVALGVALWALNRFAAPYMAPWVLRLLNFLVPLVVIVWLLRAFGVFGALASIHI